MDDASATLALFRKVVVVPARAWLLMIIAILAIKSHTHIGNMVFVNAERVITNVQADVAS